MDRDLLREDMVAGLCHETRGVLAEGAVADAMRTVPREEFVPEDARAYVDCEYSIDDTRVLAPSDVARLIEILAPTPGDETLVVGVGVGYTAAVIAEITGDARVQAVDIARPLVRRARRNLAAAGYAGVLVDRRDGARGLPEYAPYDRILIEAACADVPAALANQCGSDGRVVYPRGGQPQELVATTPDGSETTGPAVRFEPLLVEGEQTGTLERNRTAREDDEFARQRGRSHTGWEHEWIPWDERLESRSR